MDYFYVKNHQDSRNFYPNWEVHLTVLNSLFKNSPSWESQGQPFILLSNYAYYGNAKSNSQSLASKWASYWITKNWNRTSSRHDLAVATVTAQYLFWTPNILHASIYRQKINGNLMISQLVWWEDQQAAKQKCTLSSENAERKNWTISRNHTKHLRFIIFLWISINQLLHLNELTQIAAKLTVV